MADPLTFLHDTCESCGTPVDVIAPSWSYLNLAVLGTRGTWHHDPSREARCTACALQEASARDRPGLERRLRAFQERRAMTGLPARATLYYVRGTSDGGGFDQFLARATDPLPASSTIPRFFLTPDDPEDETATVLFLGWDFATPDRQAIARYTWNVDHPDREALLLVDGWSRVSNETMSDLLTRSRVFITDAQRRGRPPGRTLTREEVLNAYRKLYETIGRAPDQSEVATELDVATRTVRRTIETDWPAFDAIARRSVRSHTVRINKPR